MITIILAGQIQNLNRRTRVDGVTRGRAELVAGSRRRGQDVAERRAQELAGRRARDGEGDGGGGGGGGAGGAGWGAGRRARDGERDGGRGMGSGTTDCEGMGAERGGRKVLHGQGCCGWVIVLTCQGS